MILCILVVIWLILRFVELLYGKREERGKGRRKRARI